MTTVKQVGKEWTRKHTLKSALWFFLYLVIYVVLAGVLVLGGKLGEIGEIMRAQGANYVYAIFCSLLLVIIMYLYFIFENKDMISNGKNITLLFSILYLHLILSCVIGYKFDIYARPVALVRCWCFRWSAEEKRSL